MAVFFLLVGLEIKREMLDGELSSLAAAALPGIAALGGMVVPALIYVAVNCATPAPGAAGRSRWPPTSPSRSACCRCSAARVPASLKVFLTALAIIDDLGAIIIIAIFYTSGLSLASLGAAFASLPCSSCSTACG